MLIKKSFDISVPNQPCPLSTYVSALDPASKLPGSKQSYTISHRRTKGFRDRETKFQKPPQLNDKGERAWTMMAFLETFMVCVQARGA